MNMKFLLPLILSASFVLAQDGTLAPLPSDGFVTLQQVMTDFSTHPTQAQQKYDGNRITVYGRVGHISKGDDMAGNPMVAYLQKSDMEATPDVKCIFSPDDVPTGQGNVEISENHQNASIFSRNSMGEITRQTSYLNVGDMVGIRGTVSDFEVGDVVMKDCHRVSKDKLAGILQQHGIQ